MPHFEDAISLINNSIEVFGRLEIEYSKSINETTIRPALLIDIKNLLENLRSSLDYSARGIVTKYVSSLADSAKIYFPYALENQSIAEYQDHLKIKHRWVASLPTKVALLFESFQAFSDSNNKWLPIFMELTNTNKHQQLVPQIRKQTKQLKIDSGSASISLGQGARISVGSGARIIFGDGMVIPGGQVFDVDHPPLTVGPGRMEVITWVSFTFASNGESALPFLKTALKGCENIVTILAKA